MDGEHAASQTSPHAYTLLTFSTTPPISQDLNSLLGNRLHAVRPFTLLSRSLFPSHSHITQLLPSFSQLKENYDRKSGDGLSLAFVVIWLAGDFLNLVGAWRQELLWTMIILAAYYTLCDIALIGQYYYYKRHHEYYHPALPAHDEPASESTPLIPGKPASSPSAPRSLRMEILRYIAAALVVLLTGVAAWAVEQYSSGRNRGDGPIEPPPSKPEGPGWRWDAQVYGWLSAVLYLASRVPQIFKNRTTKCEGLSLALFLFAVAGNVTYVLSIVVKSRDEEYLIESASWLVGSVGTILLDFVVLGQFVAYREERMAMAVAAATVEQQRD